MYACACVKWRIPGRGMHSFTLALATPSRRHLYLTLQSGAIINLYNVLLTLSRLQLTDGIAGQRDGGQTAGGGTDK